MDLDRPMSAFASFRSIIELWGRSREALATELPGQISATQVSKWWQRDFIPPQYWAGLLETERAREAGVTSDVLTRLAARAEARA